MRCMWCTRNFICDNHVYIVQTLISVINYEFTITRSEFGWVMGKTVHSIHTITNWIILQNIRPYWTRASPTEFYIDPDLHARSVLIVMNSTHAVNSCNACSDLVQLMHFSFCSLRIILQMDRFVFCNKIYYAMVLKRSETIAKTLFIQAFINTETRWCQLWWLFRRQIVAIWKKH